MNAVEKLEAAITKLERDKAKGTPGPWFLTYKATTHPRVWGNASDDVPASSALVACEVAQERWGTWPDHVVRKFVKNPILAAFSSTEGRLTTTRAGAFYWLSALDSFDAFGGYVGWEHSGFRPIIDATDEQRAHARRVLERLANFPVAVTS